ncbi:unnamed protein product [Phytophthora fragariaefolia]|uniref:Unnamed protein product n=1 Tax=Phytophthora fragariaefolia TaxID=1490495 RepID=A0A9W7CUC0_9STRA|nr:unnamed protein product [Phytophthora fragariaefolia]
MHGRKYKKMPRNPRTLSYLINAQRDFTPIDSKFGLLSDAIEVLEDVYNHFPIRKQRKNEELKPLLLPLDTMECSGANCSCPKLTATDPCVVCGCGVLHLCTDDLNDEEVSPSVFVAISVCIDFGLGCCCAVHAWVLISLYVGLVSRIVKIVAVVMLFRVVARATDSIARDTSYDRQQFSSTVPVKSHVLMLLRVWRDQLQYGYVPVGQDATGWLGQVVSFHFSSQASAPTLSVVPSTVTTPSSPKRTMSLGDYKKAHDNTLFDRDELEALFDVGSDADMEDEEEDEETSSSIRVDRPLADAVPLSSPRSGGDSTPSGVVASRTGPVRDPWVPSTSEIQSRFGRPAPPRQYALYSCSGIIDDDVTKELDFDPATDQSRDYYMGLFH